MDRLEKEESYIHFVSCIEDLNGAWRILKQIKKRKKNSLAYAAFKFALIEYSKPYKISYGKLKNRCLKTEYIPTEHLNLHNRIITARDTSLAHSDLTIKDATLYVSKHPWGKETQIGQNVINVAHESSRIDEVIDLIEKTLWKMYDMERRLKGELDITIS